MVLSLQALMFYPAMPELFLLLASTLVLLFGLFFPVRTKLLYCSAQLAVIGTLCWLLMLHLVGTPTTSLFEHSFLWDPLAALLKTSIISITLLVFVFAQSYLEIHGIPATEFYALSLLATLGMLVLVSATSLISFYLGLELSSLPLYALVALRRDSKVSTEAAMKFFLMGAMASAMLLYGFSLLYGATGSLQLDEIARHLVSSSSQQSLLIIGFVLALVGILFKLGAVPFHMWVPDVYQGAFLAVTLLISTTPKIAGLGMAIRLLYHEASNTAFLWQPLLVLIAVVSIALGNLVAIVQTNIRRMLAYSAIAHIGYMLLGLVADSHSGYAAALFYMLSYSLMSLGIFAVLALISKTGLDVEEIGDLHGLNVRNPWLAFMMLIILFSMAGIPPMVGFFAKLGVLEALVSTHQVWLAVYALVFAIIGSYYYLNVIKVMYFEEPSGFEAVVIKKGARLMISVSGLLILLLGLFPSLLIDTCRSVFVAG